MSTTNDVDRSQADNIIKQVTDLNQSKNDVERSAGDAEDKIKASEQQISDNDSQNTVIYFFYSNFLIRTSHVFIQVVDAHLWVGYKNRMLCIFCDCERISKFASSLVVI